MGRGWARSARAGDSKVYVTRTSISRGGAGNLAPHLLPHGRRRSVGCCHSTPRGPWGVDRRTGHGLLFLRKRVDRGAGGALGRGVRLVGSCGGVGGALRRRIPCALREARENTRQHGVAMSCCGGKRAALRAQYQQEPPAPPRRALALSSPESLRAPGGSNMLLRGPGTGLTYAFTAHEPLAVDARDVAGFLSLGLERV